MTLSSSFLERVSIIIPAFNEAQSIKNVVKGLRQQFNNVEILVINDGSSDQTAELALEAGATVISHARNLGYGAALKTGIENSKRDFVLFCDADGQHTFEDVGRIIDTASSEKYDMVVGARTIDSHQQFSRRPGKLVLKIFANYLANQKIPDLNSGLRVIRRSVIKRFLHLMPQGFSFSTTSTFAILKSQFSLHYIPITVQKRIGESTVKQFKHGPQTIMLMLRLTVLFEPLRVFLTAFGVLSFCTLISLGIDLFSYRETGIGDTTILFAISSLLVFLFGLLCDQVSALRREYHGSVK